MVAKTCAHEGILTGISGGSTFAVAMEVANKAPKGSTILCMLADTAERYLSSVLFEEISPDMNSSEIEILNSTLPTVSQNKKIIKVKLLSYL